MRSELLGYLLDALEPSEQRQLENELRNNHQLRDDLEVLRRGLLCLEADDKHYDAPPGLAHRTINTLFVDRAVSTPGPATTADAVSLSPRTTREPPATTRRWRFVDMVTAAGILVAAMAVVVPAINQSRIAAQRVACKDNLKDIYTGVATYVDRHKDLPIADASGKFAVAGIVGPRLHSAGYLSDPRSLFCPVSELDCNVSEYPTLERVQAASGDELARLYKTIGGSYAHLVGHKKAGRYRRPSSLNGGITPIAADLSDKNGQFQPRHGWATNNVLMNDGQTLTLHSSSIPGLRDKDIYRNDAGLRAAGLSEEDKVLLDSHLGPDGE
jgi:hypothetical protein